MFGTDNSMTQVLLLQTKDRRNKQQAQGRKALGGSGTNTRFKNRHGLIKWQVMNREKKKINTKLMKRIMFPEHSTHHHLPQ